jgi:transcriptional regulator with XRE-family HTH domain
MQKQKNDLKKAFSDRLAYLMDNNRFGKAISQKELANAVGTSQQAIQQYLAGGTAPKMEMIVVIAEYFEVSCDHLLGLTPIKTKDIVTQVLASKYGLSEESLKTLETLSSGSCIAAEVEAKEPPPEVVRSSKCLAAIDALLSRVEPEKTLLKIYDILYIDNNNFEVFTKTPSGRLEAYTVTQNMMLEICFNELRASFADIRDTLELERTQVKNYRKKGAKNAQH